MQHRIEISSDHLNIVIAAMRTHSSARHEEFMKIARAEGYSAAGAKMSAELDDLRRAEDFYLHLRACDPAMLNRDSQDSDPAKTFGSDYRADEPR